jgi:predicted MFS family arabinose efflux permease
MFAPARRASAIATVVWASTIGAVIGPNLVNPSGVVAEAIGLPVLAGPYLVPIILVGLASIGSWLLLRPDPFQLADTSHERSAADAAAAPIAEIIRRPSVIVALTALLAGQFVMVLIMTMTPLHMDDHGHSLGEVGLVISAHTFGMFALAPISGRLTDRFGCNRVIYAGTVVLAASALLSAVAPPQSELILATALFLLGFGWNLGFVAGSALLSGGVSLAERTRVQGFADALIWSTAAVASLGSGVLIASAGYTALGLLGAVIVVVPAAILTFRRRAVTDRVHPPPFEPVGD